MNSKTAENMTALQLADSYLTQHIELGKVLQAARESFPYGTFPNLERRVEISGRMCDLWCIIARLIAGEDSPREQETL